MANPTLNKSSVRYTFRNFDFKSNYQIFSYARQGVAASVFYDFAQAINMPEKHLASLINLSARTISNYKENKKLLEPLYSEHLLKLIALYEKGEEVFGNIDEFNYWLGKPFWSSEEKPMDWLVTPGGVDMVLDEINRLAEGYPI